MRPGCKVEIGFEVGAGWRQPCARFFQRDVHTRVYTAGRRRPSRQCVSCPSRWNSSPSRLLASLLSRHQNSGSCKVTVVSTAAAPVRRLLIVCHLLGVILSISGIHMCTHSCVLARLPAVCLVCIVHVPSAVAHACPPPPFTSFPIPSSSSSFPCLQSRSACGYHVLPSHRSRVYRYMLRMRNRLEKAAIQGRRFCLVRPTASEGVWEGKGGRQVVGNALRGTWVNKGDRVLPS